MSRNLFSTFLNFIPVVGPAISSFVESEQVSGFLSGAAKGAYGTRKGKKEPTYKADYVQSEQEQQYNRQLTVTKLGFAAEDPQRISLSPAGYTRPEVQALFLRFQNIAALAQQSSILTRNLFDPIPSGGPAKTRAQRRMSSSA